MHRRIIQFLLLTIVVAQIFSTSGCNQKEIDTNELLLQLCESVSEGETRQLLYSLIPGEDFEKLEFVDMGWIYNGKWEEPNCSSRIEKLSIRLPIDDSGYELHIIKGFNVSDSGELTTLLNKRLEKMQNSEIREYAPQSFEKYYRSAEIYTYKGYVFLLATPDNAAVKKLIKKLI